MHKEKALTDNFNGGKALQFVYFRGIRLNASAYQPSRTAAGRFLV